VPCAQGHTKLRGDGFRHLPGCQRRVFTLALVHPFAQRRMGRLGMTVPTIQQRFPRPPTGFVLGAQVRHLGSGDIQSQFGAHRRKTFASFQTLQEAFQALGFLTHGRRVAHKLSPMAKSRSTAYRDLAHLSSSSYAVVKVRSRLMLSSDSRR
jgi:hypothetical protein